MEKDILTAKLREGANAYREAIPSLLEMAGNDIQSLATNALTEIDFLMRGANPGSYASSRLASILKQTKDDPSVMLNTYYALVSSKYVQRLDLVTDIQATIDEFSIELEAVERIKNKKRLEILYDSCKGIITHFSVRSNFISA